MSQKGCVFKYKWIYFNELAHGSEGLVSPISGGWKPREDLQMESKGINAMEQV